MKVRQSRHWLRNEATLAEADLMSDEMADGQPNFIWLDAMRGTA
jgi:hypothetical protein